MIILADILVPWHAKSVQVELPCPNMVVDPRPNDWQVRGGIDDPGENNRLECVYHNNGTTVTLNIMNGAFHGGKLDLRVYDPAIETVPDFDSTIYTYMGMDGEMAPNETTILLIDPSVKVIKNSSFYGCKRIKKCIMQDCVHTIEESAFAFCEAMKVIRLSRTLKQIKKDAFNGCNSLDVIFLPSSLEDIEYGAFFNCMNIRILPLPFSIGIQQMRNRIIDRRSSFFHITQIQPYIHRRRIGRRIGRYNHIEVHQSIVNFYHHLPPLYKACLDTNVTAQTLSRCIDTHGTHTASTIDHDGMTPLHILALNPHANTGSMMACFNANKIAALIMDNRGRTALDYLIEYDNLDDHTLLVVALCIHREMTT